MQHLLTFTPPAPSAIPGDEVLTQVENMVQALASGQYGTERPVDARPGSYFIKGPRVAGGKTWIDWVWWDGTLELTVWSFNLTDATFSAALEPTIIDPILVTASGDVTIPLTGKWMIEVQAAGGNGGGVLGLAGTGRCASGGGSGGYVTAVAHYEKGVVVPVVIGAPSAVDGGDGGDTTFDAVTATGGLGGRSADSSSTASYAMAANKNVRGGSAGGAGVSTLIGGSGTQGTLSSGYGGSSPFGEGGSGRNLGSDNGQNGISATGYGAGGGGALSRNTAGTFTGGRGAQGCVKLTYLGA